MTGAIYLRVTRSKPERGTGRVVQGSWGAGGARTGLCPGTDGEDPGAETSWLYSQHRPHQD